MCCGLALTLTTSGHTAGVGVPQVLQISASCVISVSPRNMGLYRWSWRRGRGRAAVQEGRKEP